MKKIFTIGYSGFEIEDFIRVLKSFSVNCVIDVRSIPFSKMFSAYNREELEIKLNENDILYRNYSYEFGARQSEEKFFSNNIFDFEKFMKSEQFLTGIEKVSKGIKKGYNFVLMCAEKDPINCHRSIMVAKGFYDNQYEVIHIINKDYYETQQELELRLLEMYHPNRFQLNLFGDDLCEDELIIDSYRKRNVDIGYNKNKDKEGDYK